MIYLLTSVLAEDKTNKIGKVYPISDVRHMPSKKDAPGLNELEVLTTRRMRIDGQTEIAKRSAYAVINTNSVLRDETSYKLKIYLETDATPSISGGSGGLAYGLAIYQFLVGLPIKNVNNEELARDPSSAIKLKDMHIAVTAELLIDGKVGLVDDVIAKFNEFCNYVERKRETENITEFKCFYPAVTPELVTDSEQWRKLEKRVNDLNGKLIAVTSLQQALKTLLGKGYIDNKIQPYKGLNTFTFEDKLLYFGREDAVQEALKRLLPRFKTNQTMHFIVYGNSGVGKSSFVQAGLLPHLYDLRDKEHIKFQNKNHNSEATNIKQVIHLVIQPSTGQADLIGHFLTLLNNISETKQYSFDTEKIINNDPSTDNNPSSEDESRWNEIELLKHSNKLIQCLVESATLLIIVIDQLEEIQTSKNINDTERTLFIKIINNLVQNSDAHIWVISSVRSENHSGCKALFDKQTKELNLQSFELTKPDGYAFQKMITLPAQRVGLSIEHNLAIEIVSDLENIGNQLPLLEFTLEQLYNQWTLKKENKKLGLIKADYQALEGIGNLLTSQADKFLARLNTKQQIYFKTHLLGKMINRNAETGQLTNQKVDPSTLKEPDLANDIFHELNNFHLISRDEKKQIKFTHEILLNEWPVVMKEWVEAEEAKALQAEKRKARKLKGVIALFASLFVVAVVMGGVVYEQRNNVIYQHKQSLVESARNEIEKGNYDTALLLSLNALPNDYLTLFSDPKSNSAIPELYNAMLMMNDEMTIETNKVIEHLELSHNNKSLLIVAEETLTILSLVGNKTLKISPKGGETIKYAFWLLDKKDEILFVSEAKGDSTCFRLTIHNIKTKKQKDKVFNCEGYSKFTHVAFNDKNELIAISTDNSLFLSGNAVNIIDISSWTSRVVDTDRDVKQLIFIENANVLAIVTETALWLNQFTSKEPSKKIKISENSYLSLTPNGEFFFYLLEPEKEFESTRTFVIGNVNSSKYDTFDFPHNISQINVDADKFVVFSLWDGSTFIYGLDKEINLNSALHHIKHNTPIKLTLFSLDHKKVITVSLDKIKIRTIKSKIPLKLRAKQEDIDAIIEFNQKQIKNTNDSFSVISPDQKLIAEMKFFQGVFYTDVWTLTQGKRIKQVIRIKGKPYYFSQNSQSLLVMDEGFVSIFELVKILNKPTFEHLFSFNFTVKFAAFGEKESDLYLVLNDDSIVRLPLEDKELAKSIATDLLIENRKCLSMGEQKRYGISLTGKYSCYGIREPIALF